MASRHLEKMLTKILFINYIDTVESYENAATMKNIRTS